MISIYLKNKLSSQHRNWFALLAVTLFLTLAAGTLSPDSPAYGQDAPSDSTIALPTSQVDPETPAEDAPAIPTNNVLQMVKKGGLLMIPIGVCSFILFVFVFERFISLRRSRVIPKPFVNRFLEQLQEGQINRDEALELCEKNRSPVAVVFAAAVARWGKPAVEMEQAIIDEGERVTNGLRSYLRLFNGISTISPLLGLLGTVLGMIRAFNAIATADAMGRPDLLATGISEALLTTAAGLSVAIPAIIAYLFFVSRVDRFIMDIDALGQQLVGLISADAITKTASTSKTTRKKAA